ncbi:hypothetical protein AB0E44_08170 [Micrococcus terreus]|uniref:hypothetical protein n=1 Tax=Micrococcus terreus TaxID=574650 RepID=UPI003408037F
MLIVSLVVYAIALHAVYFQVISPRFHYNGQMYVEPNWAFYIISVGLLCVAALLSPQRIVRATDFVLWVFFYFVVASTALVPHFAVAVSSESALALSFIAVLGYVVVARLVGRDSPAARDKRKLWTTWSGLSYSWFMNGLIAVSLLVLTYFAVTGNLSFNVVSLFDTRSTRFEYRSVIASGSGLLGYLVRFQGYVIGPALLAVALQRRNWLGVFVGLASQIAIYSLTAYKIVLLSIPVIILLVLVSGAKRRLSAPALAATMSIGVVLGGSVDRMLGQPYFSELFINRLLVIPGFLTGAHINIFEAAEKFWWSDSILAGLIDQPYTTSSAFLVGFAVTGTFETTANANIIASGFANAGWFGVAVELAVFLVLLIAVKRCSAGVSAGLVFSVLLLPAVALANSGIFAAFLTNGFLYALLVLALAPRVSEENDSDVATEP